MKTKIAATALAVIMLMGTMTVPAFAGNIGGAPAIDDSENSVSFTDVTPDAWYYDAVMAMADAGVVNGTGNGRFDPNGKITWAQFATILWRLSLEDEKPLAVVNTMTNYVHWGTAAMSCLNTSLKACPAPNNKFGVTIEDRPVTRVEAASYLRNFFYNKPALSKVVNDITAENIPDWNTFLTPYVEPERFPGSGELEVAQNVWITVDTSYVLEVIRAGIINGVDNNNTFNPHGTLTRAQFCQMLWNAGVRGTMYDLYKLHSLRGG